jgi:hypothetical protein
MREIRASPGLQSYNSIGACKMKIRNPRLHAGHAGHHVRDTFCDAVYEFTDWKKGDPEPVVEYQVNYEPHEILISRACTLVWNCTDVIPGHLFRLLCDDHGLEVRAQTYAACARAMHVAIKARLKTKAPCTVTHECPDPAMSDE